MKHPIVILVLGTGLALIGWLAFFRVPVAHSSISATPSTQAPPAPVAEPQVLTIRFPAVTYFNGACARCHGAEASMMPPHMLTLTPDQLREKVDLMARGPAMKPLDDPEEVAALATYLQRIRLGKPFATITPSSDTDLAGEAATGTTLYIERHGHREPIPVTRHRWKISSAEGWERVVAVGENKEELILAQKKP